MFPGTRSPNHHCRRLPTLLPRLSRAKRQGPWPLAPGPSAMTRVEVWGITRGSRGATVRGLATARCAGSPVTCPQYLYHKLCSCSHRSGSWEGIVRCAKEDRLGNWRSVAQGAVWPDAVVDLSPVLGQDGHLLQRGEDLAVQQLVAELSVETFDVAVLPGAAAAGQERLDTPAFASQLLTTFAVNFEPLSDRICSGTPRQTKRPLRQWSTSSA